MSMKGSDIIKGKKISIIGGDERSIFCAEFLMGCTYEVQCFGLDTYFECIPLDICLKNDVLIFPTPFLRGEFINIPFCDMKIKPCDIIPFLPKGKIVFGSKMTDDVLCALKENECIFYDLTEIESFAWMNAVPTAEGAIYCAMANSNKTLFGSNSAVLGFGRIGKILSKYLKGLGSDVSVFARKEKDILQARAEGYDGNYYSVLSDKISDFDIVFNTVPSTVLGENELSRVKNGTRIIELASKPGGADIASALKHGINIINAPALPGRMFPKSAGHIMAKTVCEILKGEDLL